MATSLFIAKVLGIMYVVVALGLLLNREYYQKALGNMIKDAGAMYISGYIGVIVGTVLILLHNTWNADWTTIITVFAWIVFFKGVWILLAPTSMGTSSQKILNNNNLFMGSAVIALILGGILTYCGFMM
ncbi:MAG: hypothetical protein ACK4NC_03500 [Candidatus Gracilibacteria bacterium]